MNVQDEYRSKHPKSAALADRVLASVLSHVSARARKTLLDAVKGDFADYRTGNEAPRIGDDMVDLADDLLKSATRKVNAPKAGAVSGALELKLVKTRSLYMNSSNPNVTTATRSRTSK